MTPQFAPKADGGASNNRLQGTGTLKGGSASKVLFRLAVLRKKSPVPEPGVRWSKGGNRCRLR